MATKARDIERVMLGWRHPPLTHAARWLIGARAQDRRLDLSRVVLVTPGARAGRTLLASIVEEAEAEGLELLPPLLCTPGNLASEICDFAKPLAGPTERRLAWVEVLRRAPDELLQRLLRHSPDRDDAGAWHRLAPLFERLHVDLAAEALLMADVTARVESCAWFEDYERWFAAGELQERYRQVLEEWGLLDADLARMEESQREEPIDAEVVLVGVPEMPGALRELLLHRCRSLTALVFAPQTLADGFDELGCLKVDFWHDRPVPLAGDAIYFAEHPHDEADLVLSVLAEVSGERTVDEIAIGVADPAAEVAIAGRIELETKLAVHRASGRPIAQSSTYRLLCACADFLAGRRFDAFAALVRHADVEALDKRLSAEAGESSQQRITWPEALDEYQSTCIPARVDGKWRGAAGATVRRALVDAHAAVQIMLGDLMDDPDPKRSLGHWATSIRAMLQRLYAGRSASRSDPAQRRLIDSLGCIGEALEDWQRLDARAGGSLAPCTAAQALDLLIAQLADVTLADETDPEALETLGWLELPLDSAPVVIVTGMNEGCVPATRNYDAMLPGSLRSALGLPDRVSRLARDTYLLTLLAETRERLVLIAARRTQRGDPLLPSPLLFRSPMITVPDLVLRYTGKRRHRPTVRAASALRPGVVDRFEVPPLIRPATVEEMSVTSFRTYLASPYLFYLQRVLCLSEADDAAVELDPLAFGSLLHNVLEDFARSDVKMSSNADQIAAFLTDTLAERARNTYGNEPGMAVRLQLNFAQWRLERFAAWQAQRRDQGWVIDREPEWRPSGESVEFGEGDVSIRLRGKIDRIDRHEETGQIAILDYKTSEAAQSPQRAHMSKGEWCDLQLPLYRHLAAELLKGEEPVLGYICISSAEQRTELLEADWDDETLADADATAQEVVRAVKAGEFDEVGELNYEDGALATICRLARLAQAKQDENGGAL